MERSKKIDILKKIAVFCHKEYNDNSDWNSWSFKNFLWSEWELKFDQQIYLIGNAKVLLDSQTIAHVKVFCGFIPSFSLIPETRVTGTIFDLRTGKIKKIRQACTCLIHSYPFPLGGGGGICPVSPPVSLVVTTPGSSWMGSFTG